MTIQMDSPPTPIEPPAGEAVPRSVGRVLDALEAVLAAGSCNLTTVAHDIGLTPTTTLRHLRALEARGYLARDDAGSFSAGPRILRIAAALNGDGPLDRLLVAVQPHLDRLAIETGESAYLAVGDGHAGGDGPTVGAGTATYVACAESPRMIRHVGWVGQDVPLAGTAVGRALADPGVVHVRTGAVEPDTTALSIGLPVGGPVGPASDNGLTAALSVIGPTSRLGEDDVRRITVALGRVVDDLAGGPAREEVTS